MEWCGATRCKARYAFRTDYKELPETFKPIMHILLMVWEHSKYYNNHISLAVLMRQICNDAIEQASKANHASCKSRNRTGKRSWC